jgi:hypothetical protein
MRAFFSACLLMIGALLVDSEGLGAEPEVTFHSGGKLSAGERRSITAIHPWFAQWAPDYNTLWVQHGAVRHICLRCGGIGSLSMPYNVFVFGSDGGLIEANVATASDDECGVDLRGNASWLCN